MKNMFLNFAEQTLSKDQMKKVKGAITTTPWPDGNGYTTCIEDYEHRTTFCKAVRTGGNYFGRLLTPDVSSGIYPW